MNNSLKPLSVAAWLAGVLAAVMLSGCGNVSTVSSPAQSTPAVEVEATSVISQTDSTPVVPAEQSGEPTAPNTEENASGIMGKAGELLNSAKQASGAQVAETGQWLQGAWNGASDTTGNAVEGSLDWANQTFKSLKDQGLTTASSTGQWLSDDWQNMESWQYKVIATESIPAEQLEAKLNELGKQGWECFSIDDQRMIFKKAAESYLRRLPFKDILRLAPLLKQANP